MKKVQHGKIVTPKVCNTKKVQHEKSAICKECNTENYNIGKSATWKKKHKVKKMQHGKSDKSKIGEKKEHKTSALECANV